MTSYTNNQSSPTSALFPRTAFPCRSAGIGLERPGLQNALRPRGCSAQSLALLLCGSLCLSTPGLAKDKDKDKADHGLKNAVVLVIRHGEKPDKGDGLSQAGKERAQAYVKYFGSYTVNSQPFKPDYLFAAADSKTSQRPRLTLEPLSKALGRPIDAKYPETRNKELVDAIKKKPAGKQYLICWHHDQIPHLLTALGADPGTLLPGGKWPDTVFGWVIQLRYDADGHLLDSQRISENLMPDDAGK
jgi:hypothetical protein